MDLWDALGFDPVELLRGDAHAHVSQTQQRVLGLVFGQPDRQYGTVELIKLAESGSGAVQRELARLLEGGPVTMTKTNDQDVDFDPPDCVRFCVTSRP